MDLFFWGWLSRTRIGPPPRAVRTPIRSGSVSNDSVSNEPVTGGGLGGGGLWRKGQHPGARRDRRISLGSHFADPGTDPGAGRRCGWGALQLRFEDHFQARRSCAWEEPAAVVNKTTEFERRSSLNPNGDWDPSGQVT